MNDKLLTTRATVNHLQTQRASAYLQFLQPLEISPASNAYEFPVQKNDLISVKVALICESVDLTKPLAVIHPGGKQHINSRRWPAEYFARVGEFLSAHQGFEIVLTGDEYDVEVCEKIAGKPGKGIKSIAGRLTFAETAALLSISELFITNDTSALHLAEAVQVPRVISIFGPTDAELLAPRNHRHTVLKSKLPCAPCMGGSIDGNTERCWRDVKEECLWEITPAQVIDVLEHYYRKPAARVALA
jgi:ADP-heptose:LPS heptosyltransferase